MTRTQTFSIVACFAVASSVWWTTLRADEEPAVAPPASQITELLARIEKLERRVEALAGRQQASREVDAVFVPAGGWLTTPQVEAKPGLTHGALIVPQPNERPAGGVFLPRHVVMTPETPEQKPDAKNARQVFRSGGVEINR